jgi:hypothetical protein
MLLVLATRAKHDPNLLSFSRSRSFGVWPKGVASRRCWATQASVGDRLTPTCITRRVLSEGGEEGKERPKEQVSHRKARHRPRFAPRECAEPCSTFALVAGECEPSSGPSGWCASTRVSPISPVPRQCAQLPRADCPSPFASSTRWFVGRPSAYEKPLLTCACRPDERAPAALAVMSLAGR